MEAVPETLPVVSMTFILIVTMSNVNEFSKSLSKLERRFNEAIRIRLIGIILVNLSLWPCLIIQFFLPIRQFVGSHNLGLGIIWFIAICLLAVTGLNMLYFRKRALQGISAFSSSFEKSLSGVPGVSDILTRLNGYYDKERERGPTGFFLLGTAVTLALGGAPIIFHTADILTQVTINSWVWIFEGVAIASSITLLGTGLSFFFFGDNERRMSENAKRWIMDIHPV